MSFTSICVGFVIIIAIMIITGLMGAFWGWMTEDSDDWGFGAWIVCALGFGICLTILLYQNGIIK